MRTEYYFIEFPVMLASEVMRRPMLLPMLAFLEEFQMFPFHMVISKKQVNDLLKRKWQSEWDEAVNNKLHAVHPQLDLWLGGFRIIRHEESARIRIGHTHLTHPFLLKKVDPPQRIAYNCHLTVKHISFNCVDFIESRNRHFRKILRQHFILFP